MGPEEGGSASGVVLAVTSDGVPPEEVTSVLGVDPTRSRHRGDLMASKTPSKIHSWRLDVPNQGSLTDDLEWLARFVAEHADGFGRLSQSGARLAALVYVAIEPDDRVVGLELDGPVMARFAAAGVNLEIVVLPN